MTRRVGHNTRLPSVRESIARMKPSRTVMLRADRWAPPPPQPPHNSSMTRVTHSGATHWCSLTSANSCTPRGRAVRASVGRARRVVSASRMRYPAGGSHEHAITSGFRPVFPVTSGLSGVRLPVLCEEGDAPICALRHSFCNRGFVGRSFGRAGAS